MNARESSCRYYVCRREERRQVTSRSMEEQREARRATERWRQKGKQNDSWWKSDGESDRQRERERERKRNIEREKSEKEIHVQPSWTRKRRKKRWKSREKSHWMEQRVATQCQYPGIRQHPPSTAASPFIVHPSRSFWLSLSLSLFRARNGNVSRRRWRCMRAAASSFNHRTEGVLSTLGPGFTSRRARGQPPSTTNRVGCTTQCCCCCCCCCCSRCNIDRRSFHLRSRQRTLCLRDAPR